MIWVSVPPWLWTKPSAVSLESLCEKSTEGVCLERQRLEAGFRVAAGSCSLLMLHLIRSRRLPLYLSFIGRAVTQPRPVWPSCRRSCGWYSVSLSLPRPHAPDVRCDTSASSAPVPAWLSFSTFAQPSTPYSAFLSCCRSLASPHVLIFV